MIYYGITSGMTYLHYIAYLLEHNEQLARKHSDEALLLKLLKEFPYKPSITKKQFREYRAKYNNGYLGTTIPAPKSKSFRYIKGVIVNFNGNPIMPSEIKRQQRVQLARWKKDRAKRLQKEIAKKTWKQKQQPKKVNVRTAKANRKRSINKAHKAFRIRYRLQKQLEALTSSI